MREMTCLALHVQWIDLDASLELTNSYCQISPFGGINSYQMMECWYSLFPTAVFQISKSVYLSVWLAFPAHWLSFFLFFLNLFYTLLSHYSLHFFLALLLSFNNVHGGETLKEVEGVHICNFRIYRQIAPAPVHYNKGSPPS